MDKYAILGYPVKHSFSPQIHNPAFKYLGIDAHYEKIEIYPDLFDKKIIELKSGEFKGFNITIPFKQKIIAQLDEIEPLAKKVNAVNTVKIIDGKWIGYNTDVYGFLKPIQNDLSEIKKVLIIGAGGAANAVCFALIENTDIKELIIANRTYSNAVVLRNRLKKYYDLTIEGISLSGIANFSQRYDLIINTSSVGMSKLVNLNPLDVKEFSNASTVVYDLIYNPPETLFLKRARELNIRTINGLPMLIAQAQKSFEIWTGKSFPQNVLNTNPVW